MKSRFPIDDDRYVAQLIPEESPYVSPKAAEPFLSLGGA